MNEQVRSADGTLETVRTETLPEGALFVSPDGVLYQVVMAGSAGFRKAEPWPWPAHSWVAGADKSLAVALVPGSLLARNYPVVAEGRPLPAVERSDFVGPDEQPGHYIFPNEKLAKLAAQLDEALAHQSGLAVRKERACWILSDGRRAFRAYHYQTDSLEMGLDLVTRFAEENIEAHSCERGPHYWRYIPGWEESLSTLAQAAQPSLESTIEAAITEVAVSPAIEEAKEPEAPTGQRSGDLAQPPVAAPEQTEPAEPPAAAPPEEELKEQPTMQKIPSKPKVEATPAEESVVKPKSPAPAKPSKPAAAPAKKRTTQTKSSSRHKPKKPKIRRTTTMILSVDIGYGYTKGIGPHGMRFSFPSVIGTAEDIHFATDLIRGEEIRAVQYDGARFFYGRQAVLQSRIQSTIFDRSRVHDHTYKKLFVAALVEMAKLSPSAWRLKVVTGLPVGFFGDRDQVIKSLEGAYQITAERAMKRTVTSVFVAPQPFGSLFRELLNEQGKIINGDMEAGRVGIIDVGTYTTDFVVSDELRYVQRLSGSIRIGWSKVISQVQDALGDSYMLELMPHEVDRALQAGEVRVRGKPVRLEPLTKPAIAEVQTAVIARARDLWGAGARLDTILVSGGGGPYLYNAIRDVYPHARLLDNAFWANAEGLYRFGQRPATFEE